MIHRRSTIPAVPPLRISAIRWLLLLVGALLLAVRAVPAQAGGSGAPGRGFWSLAAALGEPRQEVGVVAARGMIYVLGGIDAGRRSVATAERYDPRTDAWETLPAIPAPRHHPAVAALDGVVYLLGGFATITFDAVDSVFAFDPALGAWEERAAMPSRCGAAAAAVIDGMIYVVGGFRGGSVAEAARYDPLADRWEDLPSMAVKRDHLAAASIDGRLYAVGGRDDTPSRNLGALEIYDPRSNTWSSGASMPTPRSGIAGAALDGRIYVFGGESASMTFEENEAYDAATDTWSTALPMPTPRHGIGAATLDGRIYIPGGGPLAGFAASGVTEVFALAPPAAELTLEVAPDHAARAAGQTLTLLVAAAYQGVARRVDVFLGVVFADESLAFYDPAFQLQRTDAPRPAVQDVPLSPGFTFSAAPLAEATIAPDDAAGPARLFAALTVAGALDAAGLDTAYLIAFAERPVLITQP